MRTGKKSGAYREQDNIYIYIRTHTHTQGGQQRRVKVKESLGTYREEGETEWEETKTAEDNRKPGSAFVSID